MYGDSSNWECVGLYGITSKLFIHNIFFQSKKDIFQSDMHLAKLLEDASCVENICLQYKFFFLERIT